MTYALIFFYLHDGLHLVAADDASVTCVADTCLVHHLPLPGTKVARLLLLRVGRVVRDPMDDVGDQGRGGDLSHPEANLLREDLIPEESAQVVPLLLAAAVRPGSLACVCSQQFWLRRHGTWRGSAYPHSCRWRGIPPRGTW